MYCVFTERYPIIWEVNNDAEKELHDLIHFVKLLPHPPLELWIIISGLAVRADGVRVNRYQIEGNRLVEVKGDFCCDLVDVFWDAFL